MDDNFFFLSDSKIILPYDYEFFFSLKANNYNDSRKFNNRHVYLNVVPLTVQLSNNEILNGKIQYGIFNRNQATNQPNFEIVKIARPC
jgi:hypothetical protein